MKGTKKPPRYCEYRSGKHEENVSQIHSLQQLWYHNYDLYARQKVIIPENIK